MTTDGGNRAGGDAVGSSVLVEIYSDVVCPWCYIGKRRFEAALADLPDPSAVTVVWKPFQLDPRAPLQATPVVEAYARKFGGPENAMQIIEQVTAVAAGEGLSFRMDIAQRSNTMDAHRLLALALAEGGPELQGALKERLLQAYFTEGANVGDREALAALAAEVGLDADRVQGYLAGEGGRAELRQELQDAYEQGITAVPTFVFDGRWAVPGAQDTEMFRRILAKLAPEPAAAGAVCTDDACEV